MRTKTEKAIKHAAQIILSSRKTIFLTGAGYSTPSGLPDFRSAGSGLWTKHLPIEVASLTAFRQHPYLFFEWFRPFACQIMNAQPNCAHLALAELEKAGYVQTIITQNIDGLHHRGGNQHVLEIHGTINTLTCIGCYQKYTSTLYIRPYLEEGIIPICPSCHRILKPDVILFEEQLPVQVWCEAEKESNCCDVMVVAGSSLEVVPAAYLPQKAVKHGARLIIINKTPTYIDIRADEILQGDVAEFVPHLTREVLNG